MYVMYAEVVELVDTYVSGAYVAIHGGSSPLLSKYFVNLYTIMHNHTHHEHNSTH